MTMLGRWNDWWKEHPDSSLGGGEAYRRGARWLEDCSLVQDWGCGAMQLTHHLDLLPEGGQDYQGVDGSGNAHVIADLREYRSSVPGIFMRAVLEHNADREWRAILQNLCASFRKRAAIVLFTPLQDETRQLSFDDDPGVPVLGFALTDLLSTILGHGSLPLIRIRDIEHFDSPGTEYGAETILYLER